MLFALAPAAFAAFPGQDGKIAFTGYPISGEPDIYVVDPDGSGLLPLTSHPAADFSPAWSPDGKRIAFVSARDGNTEIYVMDADGSGPTRLTTTTTFEFAPAWSPDGSKIAFHAGDGNDLEIWVMNADGTNPEQRTNNSVSDAEPSWSPDGGRMVFVRGVSLYTMAADGTGQTEALSCSSPYFCALRTPDWSPDGTNRILYVHSHQTEDEEVLSDLEWRPLDGGAGGTIGGNCCVFGHAWSPRGDRVVYEDAGLNIADPHGQDVMQVPTGSVAPEDPDWQPIVTRGFPRPRATTPLRVSLVPSFEQCVAPNLGHGPPLAYGSCRDPLQQSPNLTVGTYSVNHAAPTFSGRIGLKVVPGDPSTAADEADVRISAHLSDVRCNGPTVACGDANDAGGLDYTGALVGAARLRVTDKNNAPFPNPVTGAGPGTVEDGAIAFVIPCGSTPTPGTGGECSLDTTADALAPGLVPEGRRSNWELGQVLVFDGGPDGDPATAGDTQVFATQGLFVP
jgi:Tol biopolymer transport system component